MDTAIDLIWEQSYGAVSVDVICERAGAKKGSFYHFFHPSRSLTVAAIEERWEKLRPEFDRIFSPQTPPLERLSGIAIWFINIKAKRCVNLGEFVGVRSHRWPPN